MQAISDWIGPGIYQQLLYQLCSKIKTVRWWIDNVNLKLPSAASRWRAIHPPYTKQAPCSRFSSGLSFLSTNTICKSVSNDPICELASSTLRYRPSSTSEVGYDLAYMKAQRIILCGDPNLRTLKPFTTVMPSIK